MVEEDVLFEWCFEDEAEVVKPLHQRNHKNRLTDETVALLAFVTFTVGAMIFCGVEGLLVWWLHVNGFY